MTDTPLRDSDITKDEPTEDDENLDKGGEGPRDTGDEPTEDDENLDKGGEGPRDTGDEPTEGSYPPPEKSESERPVPSAQAFGGDLDGIGDLDGVGGPDLVEPMDAAPSGQ